MDAFLTAQTLSKHRTATVTFVADKAGVFKFQCGVPFEEAVLHCTPDHAKQVGYLIVLDV